MNVEACPQHLEIGLCIDAHEALLAEGIRFARGFDAVLGILEHQAQEEYQDSVLPPGVKARVAVSRHQPWAGSVTSAGSAGSSA